MGKSLVHSVEESQNQNGSSDLQHRLHNALAVDSIERCLQQLFKIEHRSLPLQEILDLLVQVRCVGRTHFHVGTRVGEAECLIPHQVTRRGLLSTIAPTYPATALPFPSL